MGVRKTAFWGGQTIFLTGQKAISTLFIPKFLLKLVILGLKLHKCQFPGPGKCLVLPLGADAHVRDLKNWLATRPITLLIRRICSFEIPIQKFNFIQYTKLHKKTAYEGPHVFPKVFLHTSIKLQCILIFIFG